ncbi:MAG: hypothetical protein E6J90_20760 [Deltaproteobacteria bacterium]|nr:MAG: hypothetical protein E6J90_20760 [Deltaproteobacteria bacterium]
MYPSIYFAYITAFTDDESSELLSAHLKQREIAFNRADLDDLANFTGGHPGYIRLAAEYAKLYGLPQLRREKALFVDMVVFQSLEIVKRIKLSEVAQAICMILLDYHYLRIEDMVIAIDARDSDILAQLRDLEDHGIIERLGYYYRLCQYLVHTIARIDFDQDTDDLRRKVSDRLLHVLSETTDIDHLSLSLINAGILAAVRQRVKNQSSSIAIFLLPSHLLSVAREEYDAERYRNSVRLCQEAISSKARLSEGAQIEAYRLICISLLRIGDQEQFTESLSELEKYASRIAQRHVHFLRGFKARLEGDIENAEQEYRKAKALGKTFHVLRELAHVLVLQERYSEAEEYARDAYAIAPSNAFIIDILCEVLIGKMKDGKHESNAEIGKLLHELKLLNTALGRSFHGERMAHMCLKVGDHEQAWKYACDAVAASPNHPSPRRTRIIIGIKSNHLECMTNDAEALQKSQGNSERKTYQYVIEQARIYSAVASKRFEYARDLLARTHSMPARMRQETFEYIAQQIRKNHVRNPELVKWANSDLVQEVQRRRQPRDSSERKRAHWRSERQRHPGRQR